MSQRQGVPKFLDLLEAGSGSPQEEVWPPAEWVKEPDTALGIVHVTHRSGLRLCRTGDGSVIVHRGTGPEAASLANWVEDFLWGSGYTVRGGGRPTDMVVIYAPPATKQRPT